MQGKVSMETAEKFGQHFYQRLMSHGEVDKAVNEARHLLSIGEEEDAAVPILYMRLRSGKLWEGEANVPGKLHTRNTPRVFWRILTQNINKGECIAILGPQVRNQWLPTEEELATALAKDMGYPFRDRRDLARVARYVYLAQPNLKSLGEAVLANMTECVMGRLPAELRPTERPPTVTDLAEQVSWKSLASRDPYDVYTLLARLHLPLYLTTSYDSFMYDALKIEKDTVPEREILRIRETKWDRTGNAPPLVKRNPSFMPSKETPLVYHLFGSDEDPASLIVSEDQFLDFLLQAPQSPHLEPILGQTQSKELLFLGFRWDDWEFRVIMRGLMALRHWQDTKQKKDDQDDDEIMHVGVQIEIEEKDMSDEKKADLLGQLETYFRKANIERIHLYEGSVQQFLVELHEELKGGKSLEG